MNKATITLFSALLLLNSCSTTNKEEKPQEGSNTSETVIDTTENTVEPTVEEPSVTYGIDISKFQGDEIDFLNAKTDTLTFIICKATEGITYTDPDFNHNWKTITENGFIKGAYHFYHSQDDPKEQAKNYLNVVGQISSTDLPPIVDFEETSIDHSMSVEEIQQGLMQFLEYITQQTGRTPMIYTDPNTGNHYLNNPEFSKYTLWEANYIKADEPNLPEAWKGTKWMFWQKSDHYEIHHTANDFDLFNGTKEELKEFIANS